ncbi:class II glutamine amidotransferase domain-containing protein [Rubripirellula reticaptiva]|uniref:Uncharacterized protein n=1 Tax=Rubripirellula reticaptiva TaxID=2528013 RepID=A0A5C6ES51_9BACT|nr:hypothetical protein [Rubripirellula reticaptiva]TWU51465.1 hypothetical protein Poly59_30570 [Rubripirellula reticaptiva]
MKHYLAMLSILAIAMTSLVSYTNSAPSLNAAPADDSSRPDTELVEIATHPQSYRFIDQATDRVDGNEMVKIHSTAPLASNHKYVELRPGSIRYFRTDGATAADGERATITWSINGKTMTTDVGRPGGVIMAVRSLDGVISWYSLMMDMRC